MTGRRSSTFTAFAMQALTVPSSTAQENRRYARRQLIWFRKEPNLVWLEGSGESPGTFAAASALLNGSLERQT